MPARGLGAVRGALSTLQPFQRNAKKFCNPKITKVAIIIEGVPSQLFPQGVRACKVWDEAHKYFFAPLNKRNPDIAVATKDLEGVTLGDFLTNKYVLWLDLRAMGDAWRLPVKV